ncbi:MAG: acetyl-CoA carboxylase carboxyltransferase subunit beta [Planctomycetes bacterium]|nr:acetyl-CoA carboxylase carboxyltransferase subunit beta [Planctomycetota bacterium]
MEGRSLADETQSNPLAGESSGAPLEPVAPAPGSAADPRSDKGREKERKKLEKLQRKAEKKADKAAEKAEPAEATEGSSDKPEEEPKREGRLARLRFSKKKDMPGGLWLKCESCSQVIFRKELEEKGRVCPSCGFHFTVPGKERIRMTLDEGSFREHFADIEALDRLQFMDAQPYAEKVRRATERSGQKEALLCGLGTILGRPVVLAILDFNFMGGSMGEVVGEKIALAAELAVREKRPLLIFTSSGGARMHEGILSLMQMAKTCAALQTLNENGGFSICVMTHPTTGGVTASFASITDLILAEPGALIGFAGPRVIATTLKVELPPGFQRAEFLLERGMIDAIVKRSEMRETIAKFIDYSKGARVSHGGGALRPKGRS